MSLPEGWRVVDIDPERAEKHLKEVARIAKELSAVPKVKKEAPKPPANATKEELEQFYFDQQPESTRAAILRQKERKPKDDIDYLLRPIPACVANPGAKSLDELTAKRSVDHADVVLHMSTKSGRNTIGQSTLGSAEERREKAVEAFTYSPPATLRDEDLKRITKADPMRAIMASAPEVKTGPEIPETAWGRFWARFCGVWIPGDE